METNRQSITIYSAVNTVVASRVPTTSNRVLDVGCGSGALGQYLKLSRHDMNIHITGITHSCEEQEVAQKIVDQVVVADLNTFDSSKLGEFDCIICSHVLEHLYDPKLILRQLRKHLSVSGVIIVALPNILYFRQRMEFLRGRFRYEDGGLMDRTHYRFFDWETAQELLRESGFAIIEKTPSGSFPLMVLRRFLGASLSRRIDSYSSQKWPNLFAFQFVFVARRDTEIASGNG